MSYRTELAERRKKAADGGVRPAVLAYLTDLGLTRIPEIARRLDADPRGIRRCLERLAEAGRATRIEGWPPRWVAR